MLCPKPRFIWPNRSISATFDCVPVDAATLSSRYQDPICSQQTASRWVSDEESCPGEALYAYGQSMAAAITSPTAGEGGYGLDQDVCVPLSPSEPPGGGGGGEYEYYLVDDALIAVAHAVDVIE